MPKPIKWYYAPPTVNRIVPAIICTDGDWYCAYSAEETISKLQRFAPEMIKAVRERARNAP